MLFALQEMLELNEANGAGLASAFMSGKKEAEAKIKSDENEAEKAENERQAGVKKTAAQIAAQTKAANKAAEDDYNQNQARQKELSKQALADDINQYLDDFFTRFPHYDASNASNDLLSKYPTDEARQEVMAAYNALAARVEKLRVGFNRSLVNANKVTQAKMKKFDQQAKQMAGANAPPPPTALVRFVKKEATFFKRLIRVKNNAELNDNDFKELLELKIKQTDSGRISDAAHALNLLFGYMISEFNEHARDVAKVQADQEDEARRQRVAQRNT